MSLAPNPPKGNPPTLQKEKKNDDITTRDTRGSNSFGAEGWVVVLVMSLHTRVCVPAESVRHGGFWVSWLLICFHVLCLFTTHPLFVFTEVHYQGEVSPGEAPQLKYLTKSNK